MKRMNITVFFDGTGQNRSQLQKENWSNVVILHDAIDEEVQKGVVQYRKYIDGVGTRQGEDLSGGGLGIGLDERIEEAYEFLWEKVNNAIEDGFEPHLYLFGFSRGAYAARWLASLINFSGIPKDNAPRRKMFLNHREQDAKAANELRSKNVVWDGIAIDFIGVWDTVEASVNPSYDIADVPNQVRSVYHALAIDEWRYEFNPTRFNSSPKVTEAWFPGCHTDIGGGYEERAIANETLWWMISGAQDAGLIVKEDFIQATLDSLSSELKFHDELFDGGNSVLWKTSNLKAGYTGRFFRTINESDNLHISVNQFAHAAPLERPPIPNTCIVLNTKTTRKELA